MKRTSIIAAAIFLAILIAMVIPTIQQIRMAARQTLVLNNLRQVALACQNYESSAQHFPRATPSVLTDPTKSSWATCTLPFAEANGYTESIDKNQAWDHALNAPVFSRVLYYLVSPFETEHRDENGFALAHYSGSPDVFGVHERKVLEDLDGADVMLGEVCDGYLAWGASGNVRSDGIRFDDKSFGSPVKAGACLAYVDGSVKFVSSDSPRPKNRVEDRKQRLPPVTVDVSSIDSSLTYSIVPVGPHQKGFVILPPDVGYMKFSRDEIGSPLTIQQLESMSKFENVIGLDIHHRPASDEGMQHIGRISDLETLVIEGSQITLAGYQNLKELKNLTTLKIWRPTLNEEDLKSVQSLFPNCEICFQLDPG